MAVRRSAPCWDGPRIACDAGGRLPAALVTDYHLPNKKSPAPIIVKAGAPPRMIHPLGPLKAAGRSAQSRVRCGARAGHDASIIDGVVGHCQSERSWPALPFRQRSWSERNLTFRALTPPESAFSLRTRADRSTLRPTWRPVPVGFVQQRDVGAIGAEHGPGWRSQANASGIAIPVDAPGPSDVRSPIEVTRRNWIGFGVGPALELVQAVAHSRLAAARSASTRSRRSQGRSRSSRPKCP